MNQSRHTYKQVVSQTLTASQPPLHSQGFGLNESCHTYESVMSGMW